tara:strand:- start:198 stop:479 length:282 start_codon:yes stop_codon:yes gene_type:complete
MCLAIFNGLITFIILETITLLRQMFLRLAFKTAIGMSLICTAAMAAAMNITDAILTGRAILKWSVIPLMLFAYSTTPLPYNYWRLKVMVKHVN